jgi:GNAT superfamily N-acetyltransferase
VCAAVEYPRLSHLSRAQTEQVRAIYEEAFPARQREPFEDLLASKDDPRRVQFAMTDDGDVVAFAALSRLVSVPWWFLEYFAVRQDRRDAGLGGLLWDAVLDRITAAGVERRIAFEVEPPEDAPAGSAERVARERRIRFYTRRGARVLPVPAYIVRNLSGPGVERLLVLVVPAAGEGPAEGAALVALVRALYVEGYGFRADHPLLLGALAALPE